MVGQVVRTAPAAGVELAEGEPFLMVVSDGPVLRQLPESTGTSLSTAQTELLGRQLGVDVVETFDETVPSGTVIAWSVPGDATLVAGSMVEPETIVQLVVSKGPEPRIVPNLLGRASGDAQAEVEAAALLFTVSEQLFSDEAPIGTIMARASPGTEVPRGSEIRWRCSRGPDLVTFPDLSAAPTYEAAAAILRGRGSSRCSRSVMPRVRSRASPSTASPAGRRHLSPRHGGGDHCALVRVGRGHTLAPSGGRVLVRCWP